MPRRTTTGTTNSNEALYAFDTARRAEHGTVCGVDEAGPGPPFGPGCCAAVNALSISGFDLSSFLFYGFFPRETADRRRVLLMMRKGDTATYAFYESPKRIMSVIDFFTSTRSIESPSTITAGKIIHLFS